MEVEFVTILNDIESSNYDPQSKGKLQSAVMLLWQLRDLENGGTGIVSWNGNVTSPISAPTMPTPEEPPIPEPPKVEEPKAEEPKLEEPKAEEPTKKERKPKKPKVDLKKDLGIDLEKLNLDDILSGF
jgi:hypothetical protein